MEKSEEGLADDIIFEILLLLPMKSLLRLSCVCKSWRKLIISNEFFSRSYLRIKIANRDSHVDILMYNTKIDEVDEKEEPYSPAIENRVMKSTPQLPNPLYIGKDYYVGGCCDGIICQYKLSSRIIYLWNPVLHQFRTLPLPTAIGNIYYGDFVGFCYNPKRHDYQVVHLSPIMNPNLAHLYSLKSDSWKSIHLDSLFLSTTHNRNPLSFNGCLHWLGRTIRFNNWAVIVFDIIDEKFQLFQIPGSLCTKDYMYSASRLGVLNGCLSFIGTVNWRQWEVWSMRTHGVPNSWMREAIIDWFDVIGREDPIGFAETNGRILFLKEPRSVFSYDLGNGKWSELFDLIGNHTRFDHYFLADYVESLISVMLPQSKLQTPPLLSAPSNPPRHLGHALSELPQSNPPSLGKLASFGPTPRLGYDTSRPPPPSKPPRSQHAPSEPPPQAEPPSLAKLAASEPTPRSGYTVSKPHLSSEPSRSEHAPSEPPSLAKLAASEPPPISGYTVSKPHLSSKPSRFEHAPSEPPSLAKLASSEPTTRSSYVVSNPPPPSKSPQSELPFEHTPSEIPILKADTYKICSYSLVIVLFLFVICLTLFCFVLLMLSLSF